MSLGHNISQMEAVGMLNSMVKFVRTGELVALEDAVVKGLTYEEYSISIGRKLHIHKLGVYTFLTERVKEGQYAWLKILDLRGRLYFITRADTNSQEVQAYHHQLLVEEYLDLTIGMHELDFLVDYFTYLRTVCPGHKPYMLYEGVHLFTILEELNLTNYRDKQLMGLYKAVNMHLYDIKDCQWYYFTECLDFLTEQSSRLRAAIKQPVYETKHKTEHLLTPIL